eukprot:TRINITY_DN25502_c0_g1_i1.p2 TRINITY_DN25502_c0_g1~~TRINITY_DN25502_c0_g1_i1.p2  ORF type:complete len:113 (-),score=11.11 TRINITY_DN25502_c0_g1_i1:374-712(-)
MSQAVQTKVFKNDQDNVKLALWRTSAEDAPTSMFTTSPALGKTQVPASPSNHAPSSRGPSVKVTYSPAPGRSGAVLWKPRRARGPVLAVTYNCTTSCPLVSPELATCSVTKT